MSKKNSKIHVLVQNSTWLYYGKIASQIFNIIISILVIKKLEVEIYGTFNLLINTFFIFQILGSGQFTTLFNRYIPELFESKQFFKLKKLILYGLFFSVVISTILLFILYIFHKEYSDFFNVVNFELYLQSFFIYIFFYFLFVIFKSIISSLLLQKEASLIIVVQAICRLLLYLYFLPELSITVLLYVESFIALIFILGSLYVLHRLNKQLDYVTQSNYSGPPVNKSRIIKFGLLGSLNELGAGVIGSTFDYFIISAIGSPYSLGLYAFAFRIKSMIANIFPINEFLSVIRPLFFQRFTQNYNRETFIWMYNFMIKAIMPILLVPAIYFFIFGKEIIIYIFDPEYIDAYAVTCVVIFGNILNGIFYPVGITIHLKEKMEIALYSKIVVIFSVMAGVLGMKYFGIIGVAVTSILGNLLKNLFMIAMMKNFADIQYRIGEYKNYLFQGMILVGLFYFIHDLVDNIFSLFIGSIFFCIVALFLLIVLHPFTNEDLALVKKISNSSKIFNLIEPYIVKVSNFRNFFYK